MKSESLGQKEILSLIGERLSELRKASGLTQEELSSVTQIDIQAIQRAEAGRSAPSFERLKQLANAMGASLGELFSFQTQVDMQSHWDSDEVKLVAAWRAVPASRRHLVIPMVRLLGQSQ